MSEWGNVTIEPLSRARAVTDPKIYEIRSRRSGLVLDVRRFIGSIPYYRLVQVRTLIKEAIWEKRPRVFCAICGTSVYLVANAQKAFFFRHTVDNDSCPAKTRGDLSFEEIRALKYKGAQESEPHHRLKGLIELSLQADSSFSGIRVEEIWRSDADPSILRKPDIQATHDALRIAFEAQLSTTFLDVVVGRKRFYQGEQALLVWVLPRFDPTYRPMTTDDILFNNNSNVFVVDAETAAASQAAGKFLIRCHYRRPIRILTRIDTSWESQLVSWNDLTIDLPKQRLFFFDCEGEEMRLRTEVTELLVAEEATQNKKLAAEATAREAAREAKMRLQLLDILTNQDTEQMGDDFEEAWKDLRRSFSIIGLQIGSTYAPDRLLCSTVRAVCSALAGRPIGFQFERLIQVAHLIADQYPAALAPFGIALKASGHADMLTQQDRTGKWRRKAETHRHAFSSNDPSYLIPGDLKRTLCFLFPNLALRLEELRTKNQ